MDPLDPLTEIINSGQASSIAITLERIAWIMIGLFFIGSISTSIKNSLRNNNLLMNKSLFNNLKFNKKKEQSPKNVSADDEKINL